MAELAIYSDDYRIPVSCGIDRYVPNVMVFISEHFTKPISNRLYMNPLYMNPEDKDSDELDERQYERTILRHSPLFRHQKALRANTRSILPSFLGDSDLRENPDYDNFECVREGMLVIKNDGGETEKWLYVPDFGVFVFRADGTLNITDYDVIAPDINLEGGKVSCASVSPITDGITFLGMMGTRMSRIFVAGEVEEELCEKGGYFSCSYSSYSIGVNIDRVRIRCRVYPMDIPKYRRKPWEKKTRCKKKEENIFCGD